MYSERGSQRKHECCRKLVNEFDHGVIIIEECTRKVLLLNKMARKQMRVKRDESFIIDFTNEKAQPLDLKAKAFASLCSETLKRHEDGH